MTLRRAAAIAMRMSIVLYATVPALAEEAPQDPGGAALLSREDCLIAVETVRQDAASRDQLVLMQLADDIDKAELLCQAGDFGEAEVVLEQVRADMMRLE